ncbi:MAG TPA: hypothetical protein VFB29_04825 [Pseudolabrys sp.]|nr:hypothetical protein [Pseudolabrys sp.]
MSLNGHNGHDPAETAYINALLAPLTGQELDRLDRALAEFEGAGQQNVDLELLIDTIRTAPPSRHEFFATPEGSGGRSYELLLMGLSEDEIDAQYRIECVEVQVMVAAGKSVADAWAEIRHRYGDANTGLLQPRAAAEDAPGANGHDGSVTLPARVRFRKRSADA